MENTVWVNAFWLYSDVFLHDIMHAVWLVKRLFSKNFILKEKCQYIRYPVSFYEE